MAKKKKRVQTNAFGGAVVNTISPEERCRIERERSLDRVRGEIQRDYTLQTHVKHGELIFDRLDPIYSGGRMIGTKSVTVTKEATFGCLWGWHDRLQIIHLRVKTGSWPKARGRYKLIRETNEFEALYQEKGHDPEYIMFDPTNTLIQDYLYDIQEFQDLDGITNSLNYKIVLMKYDTFMRTWEEPEKSSNSNSNDGDYLEGCLHHSWGEW